MNVLTRLTYELTPGDDLLVCQHEEEPTLVALGVGTLDGDTRVWIDMQACPKHIAAIEELLAALKRKAGVPEPEPDDRVERAKSLLVVIRTKIAQNLMNTDTLRGERLWTNMVADTNELHNILRGLDTPAPAPEPVMAEGGDHA